MKPSPTLLDLYEEWRRLTEAEGDAIQAQDWTKVTQCQAAKRTLQPLIEAASKPVGTAPANSAPSHSHLLRQLIQLEQRNAIWLAEQRRIAEAERRDLDRTTSTLRKLQRSYSPARPSVWQSYS